MKDSLIDIMPNRKSNSGDLRTFITYYYESDEYDRDREDGLYVIEIKVFDGSRIIRRERIVTDNLHIFEDTNPDKEA